MNDGFAALDRATDGSLRWVAYVALAGAATGFVMATGFWVLVAGVTTTSHDSVHLVMTVNVLGAAVGGFVTTGASWWAVVERPARPGWFRGAVAGVAGGLAAHLAMWVVVVAGVALHEALKPGRAFEPVPVAVAVGLLKAVVVATATSLLLFGWPTAVAAAGLGGLLGHRRAHTRVDRGDAAVDARDDAERPPEG